MSELLPNLLRFGHLLRAAGLDVHMGRMLDLVTALPLIDLASRDDVYHACRSLLVHRREDLPAFNRAFEAFWSGGHRVRSPGGTARDHATSLSPPQAALGELVSVDVDARESDVGGLLTWSDVARLADRDLASLSGAELEQARHALDVLTWTPGERRTRRWKAGRGQRLDVRRALARSVRTFGDIVDLPQRRRFWRPRRLVLLCDVSGSMERYSRMLIHFAHLVRMQHGQLEAFVFSTSLTRITNELRHKSGDDAIAAAARAVPDWSGGTRIGDALRQFHQRWGRRVLHGGPVVLLVSDGWDCGDPAVLRDAVARLRRSAHRVIWLNPLIGTADYAPLTRGLQAALPFVDDFLPVRTLRNLVDLALHLNTLDTSRRPVSKRDRPAHLGAA